MSGVNQIMIVGNVGSAPELSYGQNNVPFCRFSVAVNEQWKTDGEKKERRVGKISRSSPLRQRRGVRYYVNHLPRRREFKPAAQEFKGSPGQRARNSRRRPRCGNVRGRSKTNLSLIVGLRGLKKFTRRRVEVRRER